MNEISPVTNTQNWIRDIVIGQNFCPFAAQPFNADAIRYVLLGGNEMRKVLVCLMHEIIFLDQHTEIETTLIILTNGFQAFNKYLDMIDLAEQLLEKESYSGIYQLASFHPHYLFEGSNDSDPANYTNRSPYPMIHLLREESLDVAVSKHKDVHSIPGNNISRANHLGLSFFLNWHLTHSQKK